MKGITRSLEGKIIRLVDEDGEVFIGEVTDVVEAVDNSDYNEESVIIDCEDGRTIDFLAHTIRSIEILRDSYTPPPRDAKGRFTKQE